jgi:hypothetical protein
MQTTDTTSRSHLGDKGSSPAAVRQYVHGEDVKPDQGKDNGCWLDVPDAQGFCGDRNGSNYDYSNCKVSNRRGFLRKCLYEVFHRDIPFSLLGIMLLSLSFFMMGFVVAVYP